MRINRKKFFDKIRASLFGRTFSQGQLNGIDTILDEWEERRLTDLRWLAYMFATVKWETAHTMQPIAEYGKGAGHSYGVPDPITGQTYYGRGFVQLTWKQNYEKMTKLLGIDLVNYPDKAMDMEIATQVLFEGMMRAESGIGDFTGASLDMYFNDTNEDWLNARRIINGTDKAYEIGVIGKTFFDALNVATEVTT